MIRSLFAAALLLLPVPAAAQDAQQRIAWNRPAQPFTVIGNVHYVGTDGLSAFLVTGPAGHVLIDGGLPESAPLIAANIRTLGFELKDVKYILINHAHFDHSGGLAELKRLTGAKLVASAGDRGDLEAGRTRNRPELDGFPPVKVDRVIRDGDVLRLGPIALTAHMTPGHTKGATTWTTVADGRRVIFATSLTVAGQKLAGDPGYPQAAADFRRTLARVGAMGADVFLNFHPEFFDLKGKRAAQVAGRRDAFIDAGELPRQVARAKAGFEAEARRQGVR
ncbi:subclass B3 metallo-beta-lactamase [Sphingomonas sp.]|uniref:subclass B3 metallo-beta-lactamase n=1 Tax=Sphingomonas sp. TaxID=28214 RepID=UPI002DD698F1|nr:subclass B3 metallo-beta-lactamase [Sphingomonas sp.]